jgi:hypothetical protein
VDDHVILPACVEDAPGVIDADRNGVVEQPHRAVPRRRPREGDVVLPVRGLDAPTPESPEHRPGPAGHFRGEEGLSRPCVVPPYEPEGWVLG